MLTRSPLRIRLMLLDILCEKARPKRRTEDKSDR